MKYESVGKRFNINNYYFDQSKIKKIIATLSDYVCSETQASAFLPVSLSSTIYILCMVVSVSSELDIIWRSNVAVLSQTSEL